MNHLGTLLLLCALAVLGGCGSPTSIAAPEGARLNGSGFGSGNFVGETGAPGDATAADTTVATARNGGILGSGN